MEHVYNGKENTKYLKLFIKSGGNPGNRKFNGHYKPAERDGVFLK